MSLRRSPTLTPALLAANRNNAKKSTGPRTARGKAAIRWNGLRTGNSCPEYLNFFTALLNASPQMMGGVARALSDANLRLHPLFREAAELAVQAEALVCADQRWLSPPPVKSKKKKFSRTKAGMLLKTKNWLKTGHSKHLYPLENNKLSSKLGKLHTNSLESNRYKDRQTKRHESSAKSAQFTGKRVTKLTKPRPFDRHFAPSDTNRNDRGKTIGERLNSAPPPTVTPGSTFPLLRWEPHFGRSIGRHIPAAPRGPGFPPPHRASPGGNLKFEISNLRPESENRNSKLENRCSSKPRLQCSITINKSPVGKSANPVSRVPYPVSRAPYPIFNHQWAMAESKIQNRRIPYPVPRFPSLTLCGTGP